MLPRALYSNRILIYYLFIIREKNSSWQANPFCSEARRLIMEIVSSMEVEGTKTNRLLQLYPRVDEKETPLPRSWSVKDKFSYIGLSHSNQRVHYKGVLQCPSTHQCLTCVQVAVRTTKMQHQYGQLTVYPPHVVSTISKSK